MLIFLNPSSREVHKNIGFMIQYCYPRLRAVLLFQWYHLEALERSATEKEEVSADTLNQSLSTHDVMRNSTVKH